MEKNFLKTPEDVKERVFLSIWIARQVYGKLATKDELIETFNLYDIEFNDELKLELISRFPGIDLDQDRLN